MQIVANPLTSSVSHTGFIIFLGGWGGGEASGGGLKKTIFFSTNKSQSSKSKRMEISKAKI